jgi:hypothetical protein
MKNSRTVETFKTANNKTTLIKEAMKTHSHSHPDLMYRHCAGLPASLLRAAQICLALTQLPKIKKRGIHREFSSVR